MLLILLLACGDDTCESERLSVGDTDRLGDFDFTVADVLDTLSGARTVNATSADGGVEAKITTERGEGSALFVDQTLVSRLDADDVNPLYSDYELGPVCRDEVHVPVLVTLTAEALGIAIAVEGQALAPWPSPNGGNGVLVDVDMPLDTPTLPAPPADATAASITAMYGASELESLRLTWTTEESSEDILRTE